MKSNLAFWLLSLLVAKVASTCANHTAGSVGQKDGIQQWLLPRVDQLVGLQAGLLAGRLVDWLHGGSMVVVDRVGVTNVE